VTSKAMTKLEQVARAMHESYEVAAKRVGWATQESCRVPFDDLPEANKLVMYASARAAIDALKDPTPEMIEAGAGCNVGFTMTIEGMSKTFTPEDLARQNWQAMLNAVGG
jgi:hypothetical protein